MSRFWINRARSQPWIAVLAAYLLGLQVLLGGLAAGHLGAAGNLSSSDYFIICAEHGGGSSQGNPGQPPADHSPCDFCTLASAACAILPVDQTVSALDRLTYSEVALPGNGQVIDHFSPTGQYPRGPPQAAFFAA